MRAGGSPPPTRAVWAGASGDCPSEDPLGDDGPFNALVTVSAWANPRESLPSHDFGNDPPRWDARRTRAARTKWSSTLTLAAASLPCGVLATVRHTSVPRAWRPSRIRTRDFGH